MAKKCFNEDTFGQQGIGQGSINTAQVPRIHFLREKLACVKGDSWLIKSLRYFHTKLTDLSGSVKSTGYFHLVLLLGGLKMMRIKIEEFIPFVHRRPPETNVVV